VDLITNDMDHEKIHTGQVLDGRYESRITASPMQRLIAEWLTERARFMGSLVGLTDEQFNSETASGQWTYRVVAKHVLAVEQESLKTIAADRAAGVDRVSSKNSLMSRVRTSSARGSGSNWRYELRGGLHDETTRARRSDSRQP